MTNTGSHEDVSVDAVLPFVDCFRLLSCGIRNVCQWKSGPMAAICPGCLAASCVEPASAHGGIRAMRLEVAHRDESESVVALGWSDRPVGGHGWTVNLAVLNGWLARVAGATLTL